MSKVHDIDLLQGEKVDIVVRPHPLSFLKYYAVAIYLAILMLFLRWFHSYLKTNQPLLDVLKIIFGLIPGMKVEDLVLLGLFWAMLLLSGFIIGVLWVSKMPLLYMVLIGAAGTFLEIYYPTLSTFLMLPESVQPPMTKLWLLVIFAGLGAILTEFYRRGHKYILTNYRIITKKTFLSKEERELMYDKINDIYIQQGLFGRLFNYGTIIPISASGFGLGEDSASASVFAATPVKKSFLGISFGGGKSVQRPRAATYFSLFGVPNPKKIRMTVGDRLLKSQETPILRRIEDLLKEEREDTEKKDFQQE